MDDSEWRAKSAKLEAEIERRRQAKEEKLLSTPVFGERYSDYVSSRITRIQGLKEQSRYNWLAELTRKGQHDDLSHEVRKRNARSFYRIIRRHGEIEEEVVDHQHVVMKHFLTTEPSPNDSKSEVQISQESFGSTNSEGATGDQTMKDLPSGRSMKSRISGTFQAWKQRRSSQNQSNATKTTLCALIFFGSWSGATDSPNKEELEANKASKKPHDDSSPKPSTESPGRRQTILNHLGSISRAFKGIFSRKMPSHSTLSWEEAEALGYWKRRTTSNQMGDTSSEMEGSSIHMFSGDGCGDDAAQDLGMEDWFTDYEDLKDYNFDCVLSVGIHSSKIKRNEYEYYVSFPIEEYLAGTKTLEEHLSLADKDYERFAKHCKKERVKAFVAQFDFSTTG